MKFKEFNTENVVNKKHGTPVLSVNCKSGLFAFNLHACEHIGMKSDDQIILIQDEEDQENWYLEMVKERGFSVRAKHGVTTGLLFNNCVLARELTGTEEGSRRYLIAGKPTLESKRTFWGLLAVPSTK